MNEMEIQHTEKCLAAREKERAQLAAYEKQYPNYCRKCGGDGGRSVWEYRGEYHGAPASEQVYDWCSHCAGQGKCPRCGSEKTNFFEDAVIDGDEKNACYACHWKEGDLGAPEVVNDFDCGCYNDEADANESARLLSGSY